MLDEFLKKMFQDATIDRTKKMYLLEMDRRIRIASKCVIFEPKQFDSIRIRIDQPSNVSIHNSE